MIELEPDILKQAREWRRDIHAHPELAFCEIRTADLVAHELESMGIEVHRGLAKTGLVGVLRRGEGASIGLRADMDALPVHEETGLEYASKTQGHMHACGHDGHTAMLLGAARNISAQKGLSGTVNFIFQPAEESEGGAEVMIKDGLFERFPMDAVFGLHNMPGQPIGTFVLKDGPMTAAYARFKISLTGPGGHGAMPDTTRDPIVAGAYLVTALQTIVSRDIKPVRPAVVTVASIHGGEADNVIPETVVLTGSCRSFDDKTGQRIEERLTDITNLVAASYGLEAQIEYEHGYPPTLNSPAETAIVADIARSLVGAENVNTSPDPFMGSEDFAYFLRHKPGCYFLLGNGTECSGLHSPTYNFNDAALPYGISFWSALVRHYLG